MVSQNEGSSINKSSLEKWLEDFFLDPLTSLLDQSMFRVDLFETNTDLIIEALLKDYDSSEISVYIEKNKLVITASKLSLSSFNQSQVRVRTVDFPFRIIDKKVHAVFQDGILEIYISKNEDGLGKDRFITLP